MATEGFFNGLLGGLRDPVYRAARAAAGFTLTESVLAIIVVGILVAVGIPRIFSLSDYNERYFFDETMGALRYAQKLAVVTGCETRVDFTASGFTLEQRASCSSGGFTQAVEHPANGASTYTGQAPIGVSVTSSVDPVIFDALGRALDGASASDVTVTVGTRSIAVAGETGFTRGS